MIFTSFNSTKDFKCNFNANDAGDPSNDAMIVLDYYDGNKDFIDIGANNFEKVDFSVQVVDVGDDYKALTEYLRDNSGKLINVTDKGNVLGFEISNFDFHLYGLEEEGESQFNFKTLSFSGCYRPNTTQSGQQFLLDVEINAFSVDVIVETLPANGSFIGETYFEEDTKYLWVWDGSTFNHLQTRKSYEVDYYVNDVSELPINQNITYQSNLLAYVISENKYYTSANQEWDLVTIYPTIESWKIVTLNNSAIGLKGGVVRFSSFYDYTDNDGNTYKSGFIAKKGVQVPKKKVKVQKGANVEILEGFKIKINNADRFSQYIIEFNFYGSTCNLKWFNGLTSYPIRTGVNKTNTISESIYEFSVEPFLWRDNEKYIPQRTLPNGTDFVPQTFGSWNYAKLYTKNKQQNVLEQSGSGASTKGQKSFFIVNNGSLDSQGRVLVQVDTTYQINYLFDKRSFNYKLKFPFSDELFDYEGFTGSNNPTDTSPRGSTIFIMKQSSLLPTDVLAGQFVSFVDLSFDLVIDDQICQGFSTSNGGGLDIYNYDSEKSEYVRIDEGLFKAIDDRTIGLNSKSFFTLDADFNIKYLRNIKTQLGVDNGQLNNFNITLMNPMTTPFGIYQTWPVKGMTDNNGDDWLQLTEVNWQNSNQLKGFDSNNNFYGDIETMIALQVGYKSETGLLRHIGNPVVVPPNTWLWNNAISVISDAQGIYPTFEILKTPFGVTNKNLPRAKTAFVKDLESVPYNTDASARNNLLYRNYSYKKQCHFYSDNLSHVELFNGMYGGAITYAINTNDMQKLKGSQGVNILCAFSFGMTSIRNINFVNSNYTNYNSRFQHRVKVEMYLRNKNNPAINYKVGDSIMPNFTDEIENDLPPYATVHSPLNNNYVFCNIPKSLGGSDKFYDGMDTSEYTICRFKRPNNSVKTIYNKDYKVIDSSGAKKSIVGVFKNGTTSGSSDFWVELALLDVTSTTFSITKGNYYQVEDDAGNVLTSNSLLAEIDEFNDQILSGKNYWTLQDDLFQEDMLINRFDQVVIFAKYMTSGENDVPITSRFPNYFTKGFGTFSGATNLYSAYNTSTFSNEGMFIDELNTDLDHCLYFSNEMESNLGGDGDGIYVKCDGRIDNDDKPIDTAINVLNNQIKQINTDKTLNADDLGDSKNYQIREQVDSKKTFKDMLMQFAEDTHSMVVFDRDDNLVAKSIDLRKMNPKRLVNITAFDKTNVVKNSTSKIKQSDFKDIATSVSMKYHYHTGKGKADKVITAKLSTNSTTKKKELIVTGLEADIHDDVDVVERKEKVKNNIINNLQESMIISNQYYDTGRENNVEVTRERFYVSDDTNSLENLGSLFVKYAEYKIFNKWEMSFTASIEHFENLELGDVVSFELDSINSGKPVYGFLSGIQPKFYEGKCVFTLTTNVDPFLYSRLYNKWWDSGDTDLDDYDVNNRKNTEIFKLPYKDPNNVDTYPDSSNVDDVGYDINNNQFTNNTFADADGDSSPIT